MRVIVTRPAAQADEWVEQLRAAGIDAVALPLIGIAPVENAAEIHSAWHGLPTRRLVFFVSPNAVEQFFAGRPDGVSWPPVLLAGSPGPGTTRVLTRLGLGLGQVIEPASDAAQFDSESLWEELCALDWRGASVLIVRGDGGRDWLARTLAAAGAQVDHVAAYRRVAPSFDGAQADLLRAATEGPASHLWLFSSSEAIDNLEAACGAGRTGWHQAAAIATHPRIAARALQSGFSRVIEARPSLAAVIACIQSFRP